MTNTQSSIINNQSPAETPLVSIVCITYNQEKYIGEALDSLLMQQTSFPYEIIVADDVSSDGTQAICEKYAKRYPEIIHYIRREKNVGGMMNEYMAVQEAKGKYIAFCEGDDYWIDVNKLQQQVDFLESHPDYSLCATRFYSEYTDGRRELNPHVLFEQYPEGYTITNRENLFIEWSTQQVTLLWRKELEEYDFLLTHYAFARDTHMCYHLLKRGKGYCLPMISAVYRRSGEGVYSSQSLLNQYKMFLLTSTQIELNNPDDPTLPEHTYRTIAGYERTMMDCFSDPEAHIAWHARNLFKALRKRGDYKEIASFSKRLLIRKLVQIKHRLSGREKC